MADKIVVLNADNIAQFGSPMDFCRSPKNVFVAGFISSPTMNFIEQAQRHGAVKIGVRPEHMRISTTEGEWRGKVGVAEHLGSDTFLHVHTDEVGTINVRADGEVPVTHGDTVWLTPAEGRIHRFANDGLTL